MGVQDNIEAAKAGYAAFARGDADTLKDLLDASVEWVVRGDSSVSGIKHGTDETLAYFAQLGEKGLTASPDRFIGDGNTVVVLSNVGAGGEQVSAVDVIEYNDQSKVSRFEAFGGEELIKRVFG